MVRTRHSGDLSSDEDDTYRNFLSIGRTQKHKSIESVESGSDSEVKIKPFVSRGKKRGRPPSSHKFISKRASFRGHSDHESTLEQKTQSSTKAKVKNNTPQNMNGIDDEIRRSSRHRKLVYDTYNEKTLENCVPLHDAGDDQPGDDDVDTDGDDVDGDDEGDDEGEISPVIPVIDGTSQRTRKSNEVEPVAEDGLDMYTRVKRVRKKIKRDMYGMPINDEDDEEDDEEVTHRSKRRKICHKSSHDDDDVNDAEDSSGDGDDDVEEGDDDDEEEVESRPRKQYFLREHKPKTQPFVAAPATSNRTRKIHSIHHSPAHRSHSFDSSYRSPARRNSRRRAAFHGSSSTSSSSSSDSDNERRFERRKAKSMAKSRNRCLPMNLTKEDVATGVLRDRIKVGSSLADIDPMSVDKTVNFESVGGFGKHIRALKEMIVFPLLYPEVFERFKINPPRGVLFYGPPGTGKTLVARALANECSTGEKKVAFFMRKGADCLSKWVGESERQLRLLFDQAYQVRPSIIFFDEIDGLAPVRSSRQDQIHSSIVSTLLALMDGLDSRGEIVVIGATNRLDSIDPALRRPGRFDREFMFPLPSLDARADILKIHTKAWEPKLVEPFIREVAQCTVGYCGADLRALCTEAALCALRRRYPQIYTSTDKLQLDVTTIQISAVDFQCGMKAIVPTAQRSVVSPGRALSFTVQPLLQRMLDSMLVVLGRIFPLIKLSNVSTGDNDSTHSADEFYSDQDEDEISITENHRKKRTENLPQRSFLSQTGSNQRPLTHRPRLLITGEEGQGHTSHLAPAVIHKLEQLPVHTLDLPALYDVAAKTPEESVTQIFREAKRTSPSIIFIPHICQWWDAVTDILRATFLSLLRSLEPSSPILLLATSNSPHDDMEDTIKVLFSPWANEVIKVDNANADERRAYFQEILIKQACKAPSQKKQAAARQLEVLPIAPPAPPRQLTEQEKYRLFEQEEKTMRELRLFLRDVINKLSRDRKFSIFSKPVDVEEVTDYYEIIKNPMDLSTMMSKIDLHCYQTVTDFAKDIDLIGSNALEYNPDKAPSDKAIRHRACALRDTTDAIIAAELNPDFDKECEAIKESRAKRGVSPSCNVPIYYHVKPLDPSMQPQRYSNRIRGIPCEESGANSTQAESGEKKSSPSEDADRVKSQKNESAIKARKRNCIFYTKEQWRMYLKKKQKLSPWCRTKSKKWARKIVIVSDKEYDSNDEDADKVTEANTNDSQNSGNETVVYYNEATDVPSNCDESSSQSVADKTTEETRSRSPRRSSPCRSSSAIIASAEKVALRDTSPSAAVVERDHSYNVSPKSKDKKIVSPVSSPVIVNEDSNKENDPEPAEIIAQKPIGGDGDHKEADISEEVAMDVSHKEDTLLTRLTRTRKNPCMSKAIAILEQPTQPLIVDKDALERLLDETVEGTSGFNVEKLERLHCLFTQSIYQYRKDFNKTNLIQELKGTLLNFISNH